MQFSTAFKPTSSSTAAPPPSQAPTVRLDKLLSNLGYGSRKAVTEMIKEGRVTVQGQVERDSSQAVGSPSTHTASQICASFILVCISSPFLFQARQAHDYFLWSFFFFCG